MAYRKEPEDKTNKRLVCYVKGDDYNALLFLANKYDMKVAGYIRYLVEEHIKMLREEEPEEFEDDDYNDSTN